MSSNPAIAKEAWDLVKLFPYHTRYALYGEWKHVTYKAIPELKISLSGCEKDCRYIMARLSKETVKQYGRHVAKVVHSNPLIAMSYIIKQIESYDNMIEHIVEASRYLTDLDLDVTVYCLLEALSDPKKSRIEENGQSICPWLKSLANLTGSLFTKHETELSGLLHYLECQLSCGNVSDLIVLQEIIANMTGIKLLEDTTTAQLESLAGGPLLRRQGMMFEPLFVTKRSTARLVSALLRSPSIFQLGILIGQQKESVVWSEDNSKDVKIIAWLKDHCQKSFLQFFDFLVSHLDADQYFKHLPLMSSLFLDLELPLAFHILRPRLQSVPVINLENTLPHNCFKSLTDEFGMMFWTLSLDKISFPAAVYQDELAKQQLLSSEAAKVNDSKKKKEAAYLDSLIAKLQEEAEAQNTGFDRTMQMFENVTLKQWLVPAGSTTKGFAVDFLETCIIPRCMISPGDAIFCGKFLAMLHEKNLPNFSTMLVLDELFDGDLLRATVFSLTSMEARNYGLFLGYILKLLAGWHADEAAYAEHVAQNSGFAKTWILGSQVVLDYQEFRQLHLKWHSNLYHVCSWLI